MVAGVWLIQFCTYGYIDAFGVYQDFYTRDFLKNRSPSDISWIGSFQLFMQYAPAVVAGRAFDKGYFHHMIMTGSIIQVISMFMLSLAARGEYYQVFLAQGVGMGFGQSLLYLPSLVVIGHYFQRRRALATGIAVSGASMGGIIWPIMLTQITKLTSFANAIRVTAAVTAVLLLIANFAIKTRHSQTSHHQKLNFKNIFREKGYLICIVAAFCNGLGIFFPYFYLQLYAIKKGVNKELAFYVVAILNAGSFVGRLFTNIFTDRVGVYNMTIPSLILSSILAFSIFGLHSFASVSIFGALYGFWSGAYASLTPSLLAQLSAHADDPGTRMGLAFSIVGLSFLVGTPIEGALLKTPNGQYSWYKSIIFCGTMVICGASGMIVSRYFFVRQHRNGKHGSRV